MNNSGQVGHGGDSGGPTVVTIRGRSAGVAGVQSTCHATGYIPNAPSQAWKWATGISLCTYVSVEPMVQEIGATIQESPECKPRANCALPVIVDYLLADDAGLGKRGFSLSAILNYQLNP